MKTLETPAAERRDEGSYQKRAAASNSHPEPSSRRQARSRRIPVASKKERPGVVASTSRNLYASRTRRGPMLVPCEKAAGLQACESVLESLIVAATRFDDRVEHVIAQPRVMDVRTGITGKTEELLKSNLLAEGYAWEDAKLWFVDLELHLVGGLSPVFVEVKPASRAAAIETELEARRAACERVGAGFLLVRDEDFPEVLVHNLHILRRYAGTKVSQETTSRIQQALSAASYTVAELAQLVGAGLAEVYGLIANGVLVADLFQQRLNRQASVHPSAGEPRKILPLQ